MPLYEYKCPQCKDLKTCRISYEEMKQSFVRCGTCNQLMRRQYSSTPFTIEGTAYANFSKGSVKSRVAAKDLVDAL